MTEPKATDQKTIQQLSTDVGNASIALNAAIANELLIFAAFQNGTATAAQVGAAVLAVQNAKAVYDAALLALQTAIGLAIAGQG